MKRSGNWSRKWEQQNWSQSQLSFYSTDEYPRRLKRLPDWGSPDLIALFKVKSLAARLAWEGKLADISDVIEPIENLYPEAALKIVFL